ncbi:CBN-FBXA-206 protein [Caenorhabditis brenneri]|uniref:CBN-FBXA-206 protein n=1 Tax=Caenorhabditis brenneri TaxID=135651 RepID=G0N2W1_CAEBE|nr:CBN-FBXA-206 protein [Caenorhabditis brenneri]
MSPTSFGPRTPLLYFPDNLPEVIRHLSLRAYGSYEKQLLRHVSKSLRSLVDTSKPRLQSISLTWTPEEVWAEFDQQTVVYTGPAPDGWLEEDRKYDDDDAKVIRAPAFENLALEDLKLALENPKLRLDSLRIRGSGIHGGLWIQKIQKILDSLQISVRTLETTPAALPTILPYLKPAPLHTIRIFDAYDDPAGIQNLNLATLLALEQWKQAEKFILSNMFDNGFPMQLAAHFRRFLVEEHELDVQKFERIRDYFSKLANFEYCHINYQKIRDFAGIVKSAGTQKPYSNFVCHYRIPDNPKYFFEFKIPAEKYCIIIEKKERKRPLRRG